MNALLCSLMIEQVSAIDLVRLLKTNLELNEMGKDTYIWRCLLKRDFSLIYKGDNPYKKYKKKVIQKLIKLYTKIAHHYSIESNNGQLIKAKKLWALKESNRYYCIALTLLNVANYKNTVYISGQPIKNIKKLDLESILMEINNLQLLINQIVNDKQLHLYLT